jgi:transcriptional regulator with XRE-family HTH domain
MNVMLQSVIPSDVLAEQYYTVLQDLLGQIQDRFRNTPGLTQKELAHRIGKQPAVVSRCLTGQENMTIRTMHELARGMDCRLDLALTPLITIPPANRQISERLPLHDEQVPGMVTLRPKTSTAASSSSSLVIQIPVSGGIRAPA